MRNRFSFLYLLTCLGLWCSCGQEHAASETASSSDSTSVVATTATSDEPIPENIPRKQLAASMMQFIPAGYGVLDTATGDLNLDEYPDMILVLKDIKEDLVEGNSEKESARPLLILVGQADATYSLAAKNDGVVMCGGCGGVFGDPYVGITIKNGYFSAEHYGGSNWRWSRIVTFKYNKAENKWYLYKDGGESYHTSDPNKTESHIKTVKDFGNVLFEDYKMD